MRIWIGLTLCIGLVFTDRVFADEAKPVSPAAQAEAKAHFQKGQLAYQTSDYAAAISEWQAAYALDPRPLLQYNIAQAQERSGNTEAAIQALELYLSTAPTTDAKQSEAKLKLTSLRERMAKTSILLRGGPAGAKISVDGQDWGTLPHTEAVPVAPGSHRILIQHGDFSEFKSIVVVAAGQQIEVPVEMTHIAQGTTFQTHQDKKSLVGPWILIGSGAAVFAGGLILGLVASGKASDAPTQDSSQADQAKSLALAADITMGAGVGLLAAGIIWKVLEPAPSKVESAPSRMTLYPIIKSSYVGAQAGMRF